MPSKTTRRIEVVETPDDLTNIACELILAAEKLSIGHRGAFHIALAGGSTPAPIYSALAGNPNADWINWKIFWGDERTVPADHADSNYRMVNELLLSKLENRPPLVMRMAGELEAAAGASAYEDAVRELVPPNYEIATAGTPRFDLVLLGMGDDGHTASLFPRTEALDEQKRLVVANHVPQLDTTRITFSYRLINAARRILFVVSGRRKAKTLRQVLSGPYDPSRLPSQAVYPLAGTLTWLVDQDAFSAIAPDMQSRSGKDSSIL